MASKKKVTGGKRPQNLRRTLGQFSAYLGRHQHHDRPGGSCWRPSAPWPHCLAPT